MIISPLFSAFYHWLPSPMQIPWAEPRNHNWASHKAFSSISRHNSFIDWPRIYASCRLTGVRSTWTLLPHSGSVHCPSVATSISAGWPGRRNPLSLALACRGGRRCCGWWRLSISGWGWLLRPHSWCCIFGEVLYFRQSEPHWAKLGLDSSPGREWVVPRRRMKGRCFRSCDVPRIIL